MTESVDIYLDVDGVLNAVTRMEPVGTGWREWKSQQINGYMIQWSPELVERLNKLAVRPHVKMHWLTTWEHDAARMIAPALGLVGGEDWTVLESGDHDPHEIATRWWWKHRALLEHLQGEVPRMIWVDDDHGYWEEVVSWAGQNKDKVMVVRPLTHQGITKAQMKKIEDFVR